MYTINNDIETFIFIHNQDIILDFIKNEKFKDLNDLKKAGDSTDNYRFLFKLVKKNEETI